ncbi:hypothetical protein G3O08_15710 [Cryomorpha ignava]|uniref:DUF6036 domain-containing protein n=1 Tax=Cryomorpha ignava TaxID=101383 RepID=A0A7K3WTD5_9FLAO|nr:nucleotidyl transferase AbiEii/AbiGii toxin family protein [Cryomorpha ignava]NEN24947.1 hypothetical protein [Cryomorpha ignava]
MKIWSGMIDDFITQANAFEVRMIMVGGGAVNFHGYQRHSADVDFWIDTKPENLQKLINTFKALGYDIDDFPNSVKNEMQNISIKFSPADLNLELITKFSVNKTFDEAYDEAERITIKENSLFRWRVLSYNDLITSKIKAGRPKDLLDIQELKRIKENEE